MSSIHSFRKAGLAFLITLLLGSPLTFAQVTITGTVFQSNGTTVIPNALVQADGANPPNDFLDSGQTDSNGMFSLTNMPASTDFRIIVVTVPPHPLFLFDFPAVTDKSPATGSKSVEDIKAKPDATVNITVVESSGTPPPPIPNAFVFGQDANTFDFFGFGVTDSNGQAAVKVGAPNRKYEIIVVATGKLFDVPALSGTSGAAGTTENRDVAEKVSVGLGGEAQTSAGGAVPNAFVFTEAANSPPFFGFAFTAADGTFSLRLPPTIAYKLHILHGIALFAVPAHSGTSVSEAVGTETLTNPIKAVASASITGTVLDKPTADGGTEQSGVSLFAQSSSFDPDDPTSGFYGNDVTASNFQVAVPEGVEWELFAFPKEGLFFDNPVATGTSGAAGTTQDVGEIVAQDFVTITGTLKGSDDNDLPEEAFLFAQDANTSDVYGEDMTVSNFSLKVLPGKDIEIFVTPDCSAGFIYDFPAKAIKSPTTGSTDVGTLMAKDPVTLDVTVVGPDPDNKLIQGAFVSARDPNSTPPNKLLGADWALTDDKGKPNNLCVPKGSSTVNVFVGPPQGSTDTWPSPAVNDSTPSESTFDATGPGPVVIGNLPANPP